MDRCYRIIAAECCEPTAKRMAEMDPARFSFYSTKWNKFPDGTDNIEIGGFQPSNKLSGQHVIFLASFFNNDVTLSQFQVMIALLQSFIESLTIILPYSPVGTMERVTTEGIVATANTFAFMFSNLPSCGRPTRLMIYDLHTLQNRFFLHGNTIASLQTAIPLLTQRISNTNIDTVAFPDDGAAKRFGTLFPNYRIIVCGKTRGENNTRKVVIQDGNAQGKNIVIVDDLAQTGGTLFECGKALMAAGAVSVSVYVTHAVFPNDSWKRFDTGGDRSCFKKFWVTDSVPKQSFKLQTSSKNDDSIFEVLPLVKLIMHDLDHYVTGNMNDYPDLGVAVK